MKFMKLFFSATAFFLLLAPLGAAMADQEYTGCLKKSGKINKVLPGDTPKKACKKKDTEISFPSQEQIDDLKVDIEDLEDRVADLEYDIENPDCGGGTVYEVGDTGPAEGLVFFVTSDGCDGLEAWLVDEDSLQWGCFGTDVGAHGTKIGTGAPNSLIVENAACIAATDPVPVIRNDVKNGESDWYLPSRDELVRMYETIGPGGTNAGNFIDNDSYWSSSEIDADNVYIVNFANGAAISNPKNFNQTSRAVRTFNQ